MLIQNTNPNHRVFSKDLLWGIITLLIICLLIYFRYSPTLQVLWICIIFEDKFQSRQPSQQIQNPELVEFQWSAFNSCRLTFFLIRIPWGQLPPWLLKCHTHTVNTELSFLSPPSAVCEFQWYLLGVGVGDGEERVRLITLIKLPKQNVQRMSSSGSFFFPHILKQNFPATSI